MKKRNKVPKAKTIKEFEVKLALKDLRINMLRSALNNSLKLLNEPELPKNKLFIELISGLAGDKALDDIKT